MGSRRFTPGKVLELIIDFTSIRSNEGATHIFFLVLGF